jgi:hypothetical protein
MRSRPCRRFIKIQMKKWARTAIERAASAAAKVPMPTLQPWLGRDMCLGTKTSFPLWLAESS